MTGIDVRLDRSGQFKTEQALRDALKEKYGPAMIRAAEALREKERQHTPVVSGRLRAGWTVKGMPYWYGGILRIKVANPTVYARRVDATSHVNAGYVARGHEDAIGPVKAILTVAIGLFKEIVWERR